MTDIVEVDIRGDLLARHAGAFSALRDLGNVVPIEQWCLVGGLMVLVNERRAGRLKGRAAETKDADIVVDVTTKPDLLDRVVGTLQSAGFTLAVPIGSGEGPARCSFTRYATHIDVLCPSGANGEQLVSGDMRSIAIPGGTIALQVAEPVELFYSDDQPNVRLSVPTLRGAVLVKAAAATDPRTRGQPRHLEDFVSLLSLVPPSSLASWTTADLSAVVELASRLDPLRPARWDETVWSRGSWQGADRETERLAIAVMDQAVRRVRST